MRKSFLFCGFLDLSQGLARVGAPYAIHIKLTTRGVGFQGLQHADIPKEGKTSDDHLQVVISMYYSTLAVSLAVSSTKAIHIEKNKSPMMLIHNS